MKKTKIEWCDATWNPVTGCFNDCPYCYARKIVKRFGNKTTDSIVDTWLRVLERPMRQKTTSKLATPYPFGFNPTFHKYRLLRPSEQKKPKNIFVCSMADLFGEWVPDEWIKEVFSACKRAPWHNYFFLTKNPKRYCTLANERKLPKDKNFWYGSTITGKNSLMFPGGPVFNTFLSIEPLLEDIEPGLGSFGSSEWIIVGAETGIRKDKVIPKSEWIGKICDAARITQAAVFMKDSLVPIVGEENMRREFPKELS